MASKPIRALLIDDDPDYARIVQRQLSRVSELHVEFHHAPSAVAGLGQLHQHEVDVIFLDYRLGAENGIEVLQEIRKAGDDRAIILITGEGDEHVAARSIREGADDYLPKSDVSPESLERAIANARAQVERRQMEQELQQTARRLEDANRALEHLARQDELTGLCTRRYFNERLAQEVSRAQRFQQPVSLLFIDLDYFKQINDQHGHAVGDQALVALSRLIKYSLRDTDLAGRYGGDEICVLLSQTPLDGAKIFAERLLARIKTEPFELATGSSLSLSTSIGVAELRERRDSLEQLVERADAALYAAKHAGRGCVKTSEDVPSG